MNKHGLALFFSALVSAGASANEKISDTNEFERQYIQCIESGFESECFTKIFSGHFDAWYKNPEQAPASTESFYRKWLDGKSVYKVHVVSKVVKAGIFDNRSYLVERSDGELAGIFICLRKRKGDWYVCDLHGGITTPYIRELLDMPRIDTSGK